MKLKRLPWLKLLLLVLIVLFFVLLFRNGAVRHYLTDLESLRSFILGFGIIAPLVVIFLQVFQTAISILPSEITTIAAGFVFGPILGITYNLLGTFLGSYLVFLVARSYGKKIVAPFFKKKDIVHFNMFFQQQGLWALFVARVAPFFPNDVISFTAGLTEMKSWQFNLVSTLGFTVEIVLLTFFGAELSRGKITFSLFIIGIFMIVLILVSLFKQKIRKILIRDLSILEKEGKNAERRIEKEFKKI